MGRMDLAAPTPAQEWKRFLLYLDLGVVSVFAVSLILLVRHSFQAGRLFEAGAFGASTQTMWLLVADTAFLVASLAWIFQRFFRMQAQLARWTF